MVEIVGVKFKEVGKIYYFSPEGLSFDVGQHVIVETSRGVECGIIALSNREVSEEDVVFPLKGIIRTATDEDLEHIRENTEKEKEALKICEKKILEHGLNMNLVNTEYTFDNSKILFYFTSDGRVDFRNLVKDLAATFHTRIELRQIGVRDEAKLIGGLGICGRPFCCSQFLGGFQSISIKMAKEQGLSLNPVKISGTCGRLMCCLTYEEEDYEDILKNMPRVGAVVSTESGKGTVQEINALKGTVKVILDRDKNGSPQIFNSSQVKIIKNSKLEINEKELEELKDLEE